MKHCQFLIFDFYPPGKNDRMSTLREYSTVFFVFYLTVNKLKTDKMQNIFLSFNNIFLCIAWKKVHQWFKLLNLVYFGIIYEAGIKKKCFTSDLLFVYLLLNKKKKQHMWTSKCVNFYQG